MKEIRLTTGMRTLCARPKMYSLNGTAKELMEWLDQERNHRYVGLHNWEEFKAYLGDLSEITPDDLEKKWEEFSFHADDFWHVVRRCLSDIHKSHKSTYHFRQKVNEMPRSQQELFYHDEPWNIACRIAENELKVEDYLEQYLAIREDPYLCYL